MQPGDIAFSARSGLIPWIIRTWDHTRFSHVRLITNPDGTVLEAVNGGAMWGTVQSNDLIISPPLTTQQRASIPHIASQMHGTPYGWLDVISLGLAQIGLRKGWVKTRIEDPQTLFCSQLVDEAWRLAGFHAFNDGRLPHSVTPGDLADHALRNSWPSVQNPS